MIDRRQFLGSAAATAGFFALHDLPLMKRGRIIDFTGNADHGARVYRTGINLRGSKASTHQLGSHPYHLTIEERCSCG